MPPICNNTTDFSSGTGYTYDSDDVEFVFGVARLKAGFEGTSVIETPALDASSWQLHSVAPEVAEAVGYYHKFMVSFDGGDTYNAYESSGWVKRSLSEITNYGIAHVAIASIREWPDSNDLVIAIGITREASGGTGSISLITVCRGLETLVPDDEPDGDEVLEVSEAGPPDGCTRNMGILPDLGLQRQTTRHHETAKFELGYNLTIPTATRARDAYDLTWANRTSLEKETILDFIHHHQDEAFIWAAPADVNKKWVAGEPEITDQGNNIYTIKCGITQVLPMEA
jgi:phage-related protein